MEYLVQANNISKSFGDTQAVDGVSLQIKPGEIYRLSPCTRRPSLAGDARFV
jgi:ABC-type multidrug transport system ATPase subunit